MVRRRREQRSLFETVLPDGDKLWPEDLRRIDEALDDQQLVETIAAALEKRWPNSGTKGRNGTPAEVVLRMLVLKHLYDWSYDELEFQVRANIVYRLFSRVGDEKVPDAKTILRIARSLDSGVIESLHRRVVNRAAQRGVSKGRRMRVDTTVVESNVHYPTDSGLMRDGTRVIGRTIRQVEDLIGPGRKPLRHYRRTVERRAFQIRMLARRSKWADQRANEYRKLVSISRAVLRQGQTVAWRLAARIRRNVDARPIRQQLQRAYAKIRTIQPLLERVVEQTKQRVFGGNTHVQEKVLSLFEPHTEAIRKGKMAKPTEFGKMVTIQEAEGGLVTGYAVQPKRTADTEVWEPALQNHLAIFGRAPHLAVADRGVSSYRNEVAAHNAGVRRVCLPAKGRVSARMRTVQRQRWFRDGLRWRTGCEARISALKRRHGMRRCRYRGLDGMQRWVGLAAITNNLLAIARHR